MKAGEGARPGRIVVASAERKVQRALSRVLGATRVAIEVVPELAAVDKLLDADTVVVVDQALARERGAPPAGGRAWIAVPGEGAAPAEATTTAALIAAGWRHVCAHPMPVLVEEMLASVQKLVRDDLFGLEKYVSWGAEVRRFVLEDATERDQAIALLTRDVIAAGLPDRIGSLVSVIADELVANALYTAPVDGSGARIRRDEPRDRRRALSGRDGVSLRWATDGRYLAIEVRDAWGSLEPGLVSARLARAGDQPSAGEGGMGLALAYACCNQLVLDVAPGVATEAIALIDVRFRPTELARTASYHAFVATPGGGKPPTEGGPG